MLSGKREAGDTWSPRPAPRTDRAELPGLCSGSGTRPGPRGGSVSPTNSMPPGSQQVGGWRPPGSLPPSGGTRSRLLQVPGLRGDTWPLGGGLSTPRFWMRPVLHQPLSNLTPGWAAEGRASAFLEKSVLSPESASKSRSGRGPRPRAWDASSHTGCLVPGALWAWARGWDTGNILGTPPPNQVVLAAPPKPNCPTPW